MPADDELVLDFAADYQSAVADGRPADLAAICRDRPDLIPAVEEVLRDVGQLNAARAVVPPVPEPDEPMPERLGRYELQHELGQGSFGVAFRGRDTQLNRDVAVKLLRRKWAGNEPVARRFLDEARITAQLQHPTIPAVHEVGEHPDGCPWMAMKLVRGRTLHEMLREGDPALNRLAVFEAVCQGLSYAHSKGVIHRDLKPENVMVGAFGEVQVMDWGLAKALGTGPAAGGTGEETAGTAILSDRESGDTRAGSAVGTPAYMAPEQAIGAVDKIDRRSDVFGLGGVLCRLLTGKPPFVGGDAESTRQLAAMGKVQDAFARLDACGADPELVTLCKRCLSPEKDGRPADAGEVAAAVAELRAAADERARRAEVDKAKAEVQAAEERKQAELEARLTGEKLATERKRRRALFVGSLTVGLVLLAGTAVSLWQMFRAVDAEDLATEREKETAKERDAKEAARADAAATAVREREAKQREAGERKKAEDLASREKAAREKIAAQLDQIRNGFALVFSIFEDFDIERAREEGEPTERLLAKKIDAVIGSLTTESLGGSEVDLAKLQARLGDTLTSLGEWEAAIRVLKQAEAVVRRDLGPVAPVTLKITADLADAYWRDSQFTVAIPMLKDVVERMTSELGPKHAWTMKARNSLAVVYRRTGQPRLALPLFAERFNHEKETLGTRNASTLNAMNNLACCLSEVGQLAKAFELSEEAVSLAKEILGPDHPKTLSYQTNLANWLLMKRRFDEAEKLAADTVKTAQSRLGYDHPRALQPRVLLAEIHYDSGRKEQARQELEGVLPSLRLRLGPDHEYTSNAMNTLATVYRDLGDLRRALELLAEMRPALARRLGPTHIGTLTVTNNLAMGYMATGRSAEAVPLFEETVAQLAKLRGAADPITLSGKANLGRALCRAARGREGVALIAEVLAAARKAAPMDDPRFANQLIVVGLELIECSQFKAAESYLREALEIGERRKAGTWGTFYTRSALGEALLGQRRFADAEPLLVTGYEGMKSCEKDIPRGDPSMGEALNRLTKLYQATRKPDEVEKYRELRAKYPLELAPHPRPVR